MEPEIEERVERAPAKAPRDAALWASSVDGAVAAPDELLRDATVAVDGRNWYAVCTRANHERRVAEQLSLRGIEHFLPQYESVRKWQDRKVKLQLPLFPGYVFVQIELAKRMGVLQVPGVARLVGFDGQPAVVPEADLLRVREFLRRGFRAEPHRMLKVGKRVRVTAGALTGMEGIVVRRKNGKRLVISFAAIQQAMAVEVAGEDLEAV
jgi:transcription antitermination factor NusG